MALLLFLPLLFLPVKSSWGQLNMQECLESNYVAKVAHKAFPLGLTERVVIIDKKQCVIKVDHERFFFLKNTWLIDVCREPVHIKKGSASVDVWRKEGDCREKKFKATEFCEEWADLQLVIQNDGLIFAQGNRDTLGTDHGKVYCAYLLLQEYLSKENVLGMDFYLRPTVAPNPITAPVPAANETPVPASTSSAAPAADLKF